MSLYNATILCLTCAQTNGTLEQDAPFTQSQADDLAGSRCANGHNTLCLQLPDGSELITNLGAIPDPTKQVLLNQYLIAQVDPYYPPLDIDFTVGVQSGIALQKQNTSIHQGDILETVYGLTIDGQGNVGNILVKWDTAITYGTSSLIKIDTVSWMRADGTYHPITKTWSQTYAGQRWLDWLESKRAQIISWLRYWTLASMELNGMSQAEVIAQGQAFFGSYTSQIQAYISGYDLSLNTQVQADSTYTWLDGAWLGTSTTIRQMFAQQLVYS